MRQQDMNAPRHRFLCALLGLTVLVTACSDNGGGDEASPVDDRAEQTTEEGSATKTDARLLPAQGPLQAGTYALVGLNPMPAVELPEGWTVIQRTPGSSVIAYGFDPEATEIARVSISMLGGVFDQPVIPQAEMASPAMQQSHVRPLPNGGLRAALDALPSTTVSDPEKVEVAGVEAERFSVEVADDEQVRSGCPDLPKGCVAAYDIPGALAAMFLGGTSHDITTFEHDGVAFVIEVVPPTDGAPEGFEAAASAVIDSLSFDDVALDESASLETFSEAVAKPDTRDLGLGVTAATSPAHQFMRALSLDTLSQIYAGNEVPVAEIDRSGESFTVTFPNGPATTYDDFEFESGLIKGFSVNGTSIDDYVESFDDEPEPITLGSVQIRPLVTYKSFASGRLWVPIHVTNGEGPADLSKLTVTHVGADGVRRQTMSPMSDLTVPPYWNAPFNLMFDAAPLGGKVVFGGEVGGSPIDVSFDLPT